MCWIVGPEGGSCSFTTKRRAVIEEVRCEHCPNDRSKSRGRKTKTITQKHTPSVSKIQNGTESRKPTLFHPAVSRLVISETRDRYDEDDGSFSKNSHRFNDEGRKSTIRSGENHDDDDEEEEEGIDAVAVDGAAVPPHCIRPCRSLPRCRRYYYYQQRRRSNTGGGTRPPEAPTRPAR